MFPEMRESRLLLGLLLAALGVAAPSSAEIYRWRDASGVEHFTTELHEVPPDQRPAARKRAEEGGAAVNFHSGTKQQPAPARAPRKSQAAPAKKAATPDWSCATLQREARRQRRLITRQEKRVAAQRKQAENIEASDTSRRKHEIRMEKEAGGLARLNAALDAFEEKQRRIGVPPGCLR